MVKKTVYTLIFFFCSTLIFSQNKYDNVVEQATDLYNSGRYDDCINLLETGLKSTKLSRGKKEKAYILLINSNLEKDSSLAVDNYFKKLLVNRPNFQPKDYDVPDDFNEKFKNYFIFPKLSIGLRAYLDVPEIYINPLSLAGTFQVQQNISNTSNFKAKSSYSVNLCVDYRMYEKWGFLGEIGSYSLDYNRELKNNYWMLNVSEELKYIQFDMGVKRFYRAQKKLSPYWLCGLNNLYLAGSSFILTQTTIEADNAHIYSGDNVVKKTFFNESIFELRKRYVANIFFGGGCLYNFGNISLGMDFRFVGSIMNLNNSQKRFSGIPELVSIFSYIDNDIIAERSAFSIVLSYNIFNKVKNKK